jgi:hypothetical protein
MLELEQLRKYSLILIRTVLIVSSLLDLRLSVDMIDKSIQI